MKGRRSADPRNYVLLEEIMLSGYESSVTSKGQRGSKSTERRVLADDENVHTTQNQWRGNAGRFILCERDKVPEVSILYIITLKFDSFRPHGTTMQNFTGFCKCRRKDRNKAEIVHKRIVVPSSLTLSYRRENGNMERIH